MPSAWLRSWAFSTVPIPIHNKLTAIVDEIDRAGYSNATRLTVLKKWFERPQRLSGFALWVAARAASRGRNGAEAAANLFEEARALLAGHQISTSGPNKAAATELHHRLREFQNEYQRQKWGPVRVVHDRNLLLVEQGLAIYLWHTNSPSHGYKLAVTYCEHYDPRYGPGLSGPSRSRLDAIVQFVRGIEALES